MKVPRLSIMVSAVVVTVLLVVLATVPEAQYLAVTVQSEAHMLLTARPVSAMLQDPAVPARTRQALGFVLDVKAFGIATLGESPSDSYGTYFDTGGKPLGWAVQAAWPDRLEAWLWHYPILGSVPYKGYAQRAQADAEAARLRAMGLETIVRPIPAYSTLGWLPDPITSNLLEEEPAELGASILHELLHGTIYFPGESSLNETMAEFVGEQGIVAYFQARGRPADAARAQALWDDEKRFTAFIGDLVGALRKVYDQRLPWPQTWRARVQVFRDAAARYRTIPFETEGYRRVRVTALNNNAELLGYVDYHEHEDWFERAYRTTGSAPRLVAFLKRVPPGGHLQDSLAELEREGADTFLQTHAVQPAPIARRTVVSRWPWVACLWGLLIARAVQDRRRRVPRRCRGGFWLLGTVATFAVFLAAVPSLWRDVLLAGLLLATLARRRFPLDGVDALLLAGLAGLVWTAVVATLAALWWGLAVRRSGGPRRGFRGSPVGPGAGVSDIPE